MGLSRLPPEEIRWLAISGIISTSEPALDRISSLTLPMSTAVRSIRSLMEAGSRLPSMLRTTPTTTTPVYLARTSSAHHDTLSPGSTLGRHNRARQEANWRALPTLCPPARLHERHNLRF